MVRGADGRREGGRVQPWDDGRWLTLYSGEEGVTSSPSSVAGGTQFPAGSMTIDFLGRDRGPNEAGFERAVASGRRPWRHPCPCNPW